MTKQILSITLAALLLTSPLAAEQKEVMKTDWSGLQEQVTARGWNGRTVRISTAGGKEIKTKLMSVSSEGLLVSSTRATKRWSTGSSEVTIPKEQVISLCFEKTAGRGRAIGTAVGVGAGVGIAAATLLGHDTSEGALAIIVPAGTVAIIGIGALVGYFAGHSRDHRSTEFVITH
jgi:hypothetical protein